MPAYFIAINPTLAIIDLQLINGFLSNDPVENEMLKINKASWVV